MGVKTNMLLGAVLLATSAAWAAPTTTGSGNTSGIAKYELSSFIADFKHLSLAIPYRRYTVLMNTT